MPPIRSYLQFGSGQGRLDAAHGPWRRCRCRCSGRRSDGAEHHRRADDQHAGHRGAGPVANTERQRERWVPVERGGSG